MITALEISFLAGLATTLGALLVILVGRPGERALAFYLGLAAGVMLGVVILDLAPEALRQGYWGLAMGGFATGLAVLAVLNAILSGFVPGRRGKGGRSYRKMGLLIALVIALHDLPEGMAIAVGYNAAESLGWVIALAIGMHNFPEGIASAAPLSMGGVAPVRIFLLELAVSLFTPLGTLLGWLLAWSSPQLMAFMLGLAAGAMGLVVFKELIPTAYRHYPSLARAGVAAGLALNLLLNYLH